jgi:hypothetical protein
MVETVMVSLSLSLTRISFSRAFTVMFTDRRLGTDWRASARQRRFWFSAAAGGRRPGVRERARAPTLLPTAADASTASNVDVEVITSATVMMISLVLRLTATDQLLLPVIMASVRRSLCSIATCTQGQAAATKLDYKKTRPWPCENRLSNCAPGGSACVPVVAQEDV